MDSSNARCLTTQEMFYKTMNVLDVWIKILPGCAEFNEKAKQVGWALTTKYSFHVECHYMLEQCLMMVTMSCQIVMTSSMLSRTASGSLLIVCNSLQGLAQGFECIIIDNDGLKPNFNMRIYWHFALSFSNKFFRCLDPC